MAVSFILAALIGGIAHSAFTYNQTQDPRTGVTETWYAMLGNATGAPDNPYITTSTKSGVSIKYPLENFYLPDYIFFPPNGKYKDTDCEKNTGDLAAFNCKKNITEAGQLTCNSQFTTQITATEKYKVYWFNFLPDYARVDISTCDVRLGQSSSTKIDTVLYAVNNTAWGAGGSYRNWKKATTLTPRSLINVIDQNDDTYAPKACTTTMPNKPGTGSLVSLTTSNTGGTKGYYAIIVGGADATQVGDVQIQVTCVKSSKSVLADYDDFPVPGADMIIDKDGGLKGSFECGTKDPKELNYEDSVWTTSVASSTSEFQAVHYYKFSKKKIPKTDFELKSIKFSTCFSQGGNLGYYKNYQGSSGVSLEDFSNYTNPDQFLGGGFTSTFNPYGPYGNTGGSGGGQTTASGGGGGMTTAGGGGGATTGGGGGGATTGGGGPGTTARRRLGTTSYGYNPDGSYNYGYGSSSVPYSDIFAGDSGAASAAGYRGDAADLYMYLGRQVGKLNTIVEQCGNEGCASVPSAERCIDPLSGIGFPLMNFPESRLPDGDYFIGISGNGNLPTNYRIEITCVAKYTGVYIQDLITMIAVNVGCIGLIFGIFLIFYCRSIGRYKKNEERRSVRRSMKQSDNVVVEMQEQPQSSNAGNAMGETAPGTVEQKEAFNPDINSADNDDNNNNNNNNNENIPQDTVPSDDVPPDSPPADDEPQDEVALVANGDNEAPGMTNNAPKPMTNDYGAEENQGKDTAQQQKMRRYQSAASITGLDNAASQKMVELLEELVDDLEGGEGLDIYQVLAFRKVDPKSHESYPTNPCEECGCCSNCVFFSVAKYHIAFFMVVVVSILQSVGLSIILFNVVIDYVENGGEEAACEYTFKDWQVKGAGSMKFLAFLWCGVVSLSISSLLASINANGMNKILEHEKVVTQIKIFDPFITQFGVLVNFYSLTMAVLGSFFIIYKSEGGADSLDMVLNAVALFFMLELDDFLVIDDDYDDVVDGIKNYLDILSDGKKYNDYYDADDKTVPARCCGNCVTFAMISIGNKLLTFTPWLVGFISIFAPFVVMVCF